MADPFIGEIRAFPYSYVPYGWASCDGQVMQIAQNTALFAVIGAIYGGNGATTFALPDLRGRAAMDCGTGPNLTPRAPGETDGDVTVPLNINNLPPHSHVMNAVANSDAGNTAVANSYPGKSPAAGSRPPVAVNTYQPSSTGVQMALDAVQQAGAATASHDNMQPYLPVQLCIATMGMFPSRG
jgi:microcystin-dependent protein